MWSFHQTMLTHIVARSRLTLNGWLALRIVRGPATGRILSVRQLMQAMLVAPDIAYARGMDLNRELRGSRAIRTCRSLTGVL